MSAWGLVLMAKGLEGWVVQNGDTLELHVPGAAWRALAELAAADAEDVSEPASTRVRSASQRHLGASRVARSRDARVLLVAFQG